MKRELMCEELGEVKGMYSHAIEAGSFIFSTQIGNVSGGVPAGAGAYEQTVQAMKNIGYVLKKRNLSYSDIVKCTIYITNMGDYDEVNKAYSEFMDKPYPARACVQVEKLSPGSKVEIEFTVYAGD